MKRNKDNISSFYSTIDLNQKYTFKQEDKKEEKTYSFAHSTKPSSISENIKKQICVKKEVDKEKLENLDLSSSIELDSFLENESKVQQCYLQSEALKSDKLKIESLNIKESLQALNERTKQNIINVLNNKRINLLTKKGKTEPFDFIDINTPKDSHSKSSSKLK